MSSKSSSSSNGEWLNHSSTGKRTVSPSPSTSPAKSPSSASISSFPQRKQSAMEDLPLDWTRIKRRRMECSIDYNPRTLIKSPLVVSGNEKIHHGYAIFCLHDSTDPTWFQGYFLETALGNSSTIDDEDSSNMTMIQSRSRRPWGLLATKEEIDECMECENGGYRRITVKVFHTPSSNSSSQSTSMKGIDWTGGDMMRLSNDKVEMNTQRLLTGKDALPYLKQYFMGMLRKLQQACQEDDTVRHDIDKDKNETSKMFELLPDVAVLVGKMSIVLSQDVDTMGGRVTKSLSFYEKNKEAITETKAKTGGDLWDD
ncbi:unnamed protein product [Cylindrotheca closterium]|uniref:Uncharacterized protein n=1 Tax=Cylindrotheca closterium TaxID=2856 RepID=A0AAD2CDQ9_9STRA|nr:unnamed protein product [Cylindrotheca closterium]